MLEPFPATLSERPARLFALDVLRGVAALGVVFWHWQHFFYDGLVPGGVDQAAFPLYAVFAPAYHLGWKAVDLFFCLSGFIFYWLYAVPIAQGRVGAQTFGVLRVSRLYPLHLVTLAMVAALQTILVHLRGTPFVYPENDLYHGILQTLFVSAWGLERGYSFNGPVWSVSVEVLLYALFFAACRLRWRQPWHLAVASLCGLLLIQIGVTPVGRGVLSFFIGGLAYYAYDRLDRRAAPGTLTVLVAALVVLGIAVPLNAFLGVAEGVTQSMLGTGTVSTAIGEVSRLGFEFVLYPLTVITLAFAETRRGPMGERWAWLGDISYSSYLLHFPLQLTCLAIIFALGYSTDVFLHPAALVGFFAVLIPLSYATYRWFERPAMRTLRRRGLPDQRRQSPAAEH